MGVEGATRDRCAPQAPGSDRCAPKASEMIIFYWKSMIWECNPKIFAPAAQIPRVSLQGHSFYEQNAPKVLSTFSLTLYNTPGPHPLRLASVLIKGGGGLDRGGGGTIPFILLMIVSTRAESSRRTENPFLPGAAYAPPPPRSDLRSRVFFSGSRDLAGRMHHPESA